MRVVAASRELKCALLMVPCGFHKSRWLEERATAEDSSVVQKEGNIASAYFDLAEVKAMSREPMHMKDWIIQLDRLIRTFDKKVLADAGSVSHDNAIQKAEAEYRKYQEQTISEVEQAYLENISAIQKKVETKIKAEKSRHMQKKSNI